MTEAEADDYEAWKTQRDLVAVRARKQFHEEQLTLANAVGGVANKLGLKIRVSYDGADYRIDAGMLQTGACRATCTLDEELLLTAAGADRAEIVIREMENLQRLVFDETAKKMGELDARGRVYALDKDDKDTLYEMLRDAEDRLHARFVYADPELDLTREKRERYRALAGKLFR